MTRNIKTTYLFLSLLFFIADSGKAQTNKLNYGGTTGDSINCGVYLSGYREFFKIKLYNRAKEPWSIAFDNCPGASERMYIDGVTIYRSFIDEAVDDVSRENLIDTLMLIYDRRMEYFGDEGNVLGRKGRDLLAYRGADLDQVQKAYEMLKKSIEIEGLKSKESMLLLFQKAGLALNKNEKLNDNQVLEDYLFLSSIMGQLEKQSPRWERTRAKVDEAMLKDGMLSCEALDRFYSTRMEESLSDRNYLETTISLYRASGCKKSETYVAASENLYKINPGPESAHNLGLMFISKNDNEKAAFYLSEALEGENVDSETRAQWYYELALVSLALEDPCKAIKLARKAIGLRETFGDAYILLGDAYIASRTKLGDEFQQATAYWAASDKYKKATLADPSIEEETRKKLQYSQNQFPNAEETFFRDLRDGESYLVEGCINESTAVRVRMTLN